MKNLIYLLFITIPFTGFSQVPSNIVEICSGISEEDVSDLTYFKDINQTFNKFIGTWIYTNGNNIVTFEITKVTQKYDAEYKIFEDYLIGNYSYSNDGGSTFIVNTISTVIDENPSRNPMYSSCAEINKISFIFADVVIGKKNCWAYFELLPNSLTEMVVNLENQPLGTFEGEEPFNYNFTIPINMTVVKQ